MEIYLVGGAVRDKLLCQEPKDLDYVVVGSTPEEMEENGFKPVMAQEFPVFLHPITGDEYALARSEKKVGAGYKGFEVNHSPDTTLEEDLSRRDLTINAMAMDSTGKVIDPFNGRSDLTSGILRHTTDAFKDDPVRVLRIARFAARYDFIVADETRELMREMLYEGELSHLTDERVWQELEKAMEEKYFPKFFSVLGSPVGVEIFGVKKPFQFPWASGNLNSNMSLPCKLWKSGFKAQHIEHMAPRFISRVLDKMEKFNKVIDSENLKLTRLIKILGVKQQTRDYEIIKECVNPSNRKEEVFFNNLFKAIEEVRDFKVDIPEIYVNNGAAIGAFVEEKHAEIFIKHLGVE